MYDVNSKCADDFINHEEILETLAYADENKENIELIDSIIEKAKKRKGLSHREASVLLACPIEEKNQEIYKLAETDQKRFLRQPHRYVRAPCTCPTTASTAARTARTTQRTNISRGSSSLRKISAERSSRSRIWVISVLPWKPEKTRCATPWITT